MFLNYFVIVVTSLFLFLNIEYVTYENGNIAKLSEKMLPTQCGYNTKLIENFDCSYNVLVV